MGRGRDDARRRRPTPPLCGRRDESLHEDVQPLAQPSDVPGGTLIDGNTVTVEVRFIGTTEDGRELEFDAVDVIDLEGRRIKKLTNWYDPSRCAR
jgi:hypothetical protein